MPQPSRDSDVPVSPGDSPPPDGQKAVRHRMPLGRKLILINIALVAALALLGAALAWSVRDMRSAVTASADEYLELQLVERAVFHCAMAKSQLADPDSGSADAVGELENALTQLRNFRNFQHGEDEASDEHQQDEMASAEQAETALKTVLEAVRPMREGGGVDLEHLAMVDSALHHLSELARDTDIAGAQAASAERTVTALMIVAMFSGLVVIGSMIASAVSYWSVMNPLNRLHSGVRRVASGAFDERLVEDGSREFADLAADFNLMAGELSNLYTDLEKKVQTKSQELVRSERLASVGFLAAGVAHEINNPLNIMSGYAEMAQAWLDNARRNGNFTEVREALEIIRQEAFRCKEITAKLLSLAAADDSTRSDVLLPRLCSEVVQMVRGLKKYRDRSIVIESDASAEQPVRAGAAEIKQVLLNLLVNALEAVPLVGGEVRIFCRANGQNIETTVSDNGVGMAGDVRDRVFEPFFSTRRGGRAGGGAQRTRGVGLGLSISHAIITSHGGRIRAESEGAGRGSLFIIELPIHRESLQEPSVHATPVTGAA